MSKIRTTTDDFYIYSVKCLFIYINENYIILIFKHANIADLNSSHSKVICSQTHRSGRFLELLNRIYQFSVSFSILRIALTGLRICFPKPSPLEEYQLQCLTYSAPRHPSSCLPRSVISVGVVIWRRRRGFGRTLGIGRLKDMMMPPPSHGPCRVRTSDPKFRSTLAPVYKAYMPLNALGRGSDDAIAWTIAGKTIG